MASYTELEKDFTDALGPTYPGFTTASPPSLATSASFIYTTLIMLCVVAAGVVYMWAGALRMQASEAAIRKSNEKFRQATVGLVLVLSIFAILFAVNPDLLNMNIGLGQLAADRTFKSGGGGDFGGGGASGGWTGTSTRATSTRNTPESERAALADDERVRTLLRNLPNGGITVNRRVCATTAQTSCTTVGGIPSETISMLTELRNTCNGGIEITGGTEAGHKSHGPGKTPVDLSLYKPGGLNECIRAFPAGPRLSFCYATYQRFGFTFCDEINSNRHWHVFK
jgi:hypothetical protein